MIQPLWVIIPAAGIGQRMKADCPKQYIPLLGKTILDRTVAIFVNHPMIAGVAVGLGELDGYWADSSWVSHPRVFTYQGGMERSDTVLKGLEYLSQVQQVAEQDVLVHDAARPLLSQSALERIIQHQGAQGAILAMPARDTIKQQKANGKIQATIDRDGIWLAQTPQKFPASDLLQALRNIQAQGVAITDECSAMEYTGWQPDLVLGESTNIKVTFPEDLLIAEALVSHNIHSISQ
ncbi:2-C-methyl-D-erythritol 4-phosphate cytidylyltransferase [Marinomonas spartinae]|uniref:2-C-methyl-D-erythritol 4-phosphate cytidylyltransferase n=1 Tax=Marinomonas spartinae TaxID=1792290 RepID=UPI0018F25347|nr:2-C-methyl-D-erythritol 4-phosphate cytidylyltransferase [Marinomonas spartinae]MBJ7553003.1 2-C-methyl-D-erythritol 4-phosphate cytidylyltransferase [Marinomonas spartinae]